MIVNLGNATANDVSIIAEKMKNAVKEKYDIILVEEVRFVGRKE